jgi:hypothetical protein
LEGTFPKKKEGTNPKAFFYVSVVLFFCVGSYYMDLYNPYNKRGLIFEATFGTKIEAIFGNLLATTGPYYAGRTTLY